MKNLLKEYLLKHAAGYRKARTREFLSAKLNIEDRSLRKLLEELKAEGVPVLSRYENAGYFIPKTREEANETIARETHRAQKIFRSVNGIIKGVNKRFPDKKQLRFTME